MNKFRCKVANKYLCISLCLCKSGYKIFFIYDSSFLKCVPIYSYKDLIIFFSSCFIFLIFLSLPAVLFLQFQKVSYVQYQFYNDQYYILISKPIYYDQSFFFIVDLLPLILMYSVTVGFNLINTKSAIILPSKVRKAPIIKIPIIIG